MCTGFFDSDVYVCTQFALHCTEIFLGMNPGIFGLRQAVTFPNGDIELAGAMEDYIGDVYRLDMGVQSASDIGKLHQFFDGGIDDRDWIVMQVKGLIFCLFPVKDLVWNGMAIFLLDMRQELGYINRDAVGFPVTNVGKLGFLDIKYLLLDQHGISSKDFAEYVHSFSMCVAHICDHHSGDLIRDVPKVRM